MSRNSDCLDRDVRSKPVGHLHDPGYDVLGGTVQRDVRSEIDRLRKSSIGKVDGNDLPGSVKLRCHDRREPDRADADNYDRVPRLHAAVQDSDLVSRWQDVGEEEHLLVR